MFPPAFVRAGVPTAAALLITLTACSPTSPDSPQAPAEPTASSGPSLPRAEFSHLHALVFDGQDRALYAATHAGVWALPDPTAPTVGGDQGAAARIGSGTQDTMGLTLARDGALLASGHPGPGEALDLAMPNLGLIRSTDGAQTWESVSLSGEVDFHALTATEDAGVGRIAGLDSASSTVLLSDDNGRTWDGGATIAAHDLTFLTGDPDQILATTPDGLQISPDAGQTFTAIPDAPVLVFVETQDNGELVGVDTNGLVWTATPAATGWQSHGSVAGGAIEAMTVASGRDGAANLVVATEQRIMSSPDLGATWVSVAEIS